MKIFNWVHRKLSYNKNNVDDYLVSPKKGGFDYDMKETETVSNQFENGALLDNIALLDMWKDGILSIGTLGFDPSQQIEFPIDNHEVEEENQEKSRNVEEEAELKPALVQAFKIEFENVFGPQIVMNNRSTDMMETDSPRMPLLKFLEMAALDSEIEIQEKKRVTLADLFSDDTDVTDGKSKTVEAKPPKFKSGKKKGSSTKKKQHVPGKEKEARPTGKLQRMITKILKKKIHPENIEKKVHGKGSTNPSTEMINSSVFGTSVPVNGLN